MEKEKEERNVALLRDAYVGYGRSDPSPLFALLAEDAHFCSKSSAELFSWAAVPAGRAGFIEAITKVAADWDLVRYRAKEFIAQGDRVVVLADAAFKHKGTDRLVELEKLDLWRLRDGKVVEFCEFFDTAAVQARIAD